MNKQAAVYIGDFDLRNENVQAHLVRNNGKILNQLGYEVFFVGTNRNCSDFKSVDELSKIPSLEDNYLELPHTLTIGGLLKIGEVKKRILAFLNHLKEQNHVAFVITYQAPTYACILNKITKWCKNNQSPYIVNCADLPIFDGQTSLRKVVMKSNWNYMYRINGNRANGIIAVSRCIDDFYKSNDRPSVIIPPLFDKPKWFKNAIELNSVPTFLYAGTPFVITGKKVNPKGMKDRLDKIVDLMIRLESIGTKFCFQIVGITLEDYSICIPRHKESVENSKCIVFYGRKTHKDTLEMLQCADYMINYRDKNLMTEAGMSTKVVESVSIGTPVIMNDIGDTFLYLKEETSGIRLTGEFGEDVKNLEKLCKLSVEERKSNKDKVKDSGLFSLDNYRQAFLNFLIAVNEKIDK